jgi:hypothetical protein
VRGGRIKAVVDPRVKVELQRVAVELGVSLDDVLVCALGVWFGCGENYRVLREVVVRPEWPVLSAAFGGGE